MTGLSDVAWKVKESSFSFILYLQIITFSILQMQRQASHSIIYFKINANEVIMQVSVSFTIKSDLFRKDLWCSFPSNGGGKGWSSRHSDLNRINL